MAEGSQGTPEQIKFGEGQMSPVQEAMTKARSEVMKHKEAAIQAGSSEEIVHKTARIVEDKTEKEFLDAEEKTKAENPINRIANALEAAAQTEDEKKLVQEGKEYLEGFRKRWKEALDNARQEAQVRGEEFKPEEVVKKLKDNHIAPSFVENRGKWDGPYYPRMSLLSSTKDAEGKNIVPSTVFMSRILQQLGALKEGESVEKWKSLKPNEGGTPNYYFYPNQAEKVERIPLPSMPGVDAQVDFMYPGMVFSMDVPTLVKAVSPPKQ